MKKVFAFCASLFFGYYVQATPINSISYEKLNNGISVVFIDAYTPESLLVMMCVSAGSADEIQRNGVANLLCDVMSKRVKRQADIDKLQYGVESNAYTGHDQTVYYFYGKPENLSGFINDFSSAICTFNCDEKELVESKKYIYQRINDESKVVKFDVQKSALSSMYWHAGYGMPITGENCDVDAITISDVNDFCKKHYKNDKIIFVIVGKTNKNQTVEVIQNSFKQNVGKADTERLREPDHHGSVVQIEKYSDQANVVTIDFYWKINSYSEDVNKALADEILAKYFEKNMQQQLVKEQKIVSAVSVNCVNWNREHGRCCISITALPNADIDFVKTAVVACVKSFVSNDIIDDAKISNIKNEIIESANVNKMDAIDAADWISKRLSAGYSWEVIKNFSKACEKCDIKLINEEMKKIFNKDPDVISVIKPKE